MERDKATRGAWQQAGRRILAGGKELLAGLDGPTNVIRQAWDRLAPLPGGKRVFSRAIGFAAPYTSTVGAEVVALERGYARVVLSDRRIVRNHLRSVHAVALVNLAELAGNVALAYALPDDARFIVAGLEIRYLKKARGTITAETTCPLPASSERQEYLVPVDLRDGSGELVAQCTLRSLVGPKPGRAAKEASGE